MSGDGIFKVFVAEAMELQSNLFLLQSQLTSGINRVNKLVQLAISVGIAPESLRTTTLAGYELIPVTDRYEYHEAILTTIPMPLPVEEEFDRNKSVHSTEVNQDVHELNNVPKVSVSSSDSIHYHPLKRQSLVKASQGALRSVQNRNISATIADNHISLGLKWDSCDYILASRADTNISVEEETQENTKNNENSTNNVKQWNKSFPESGDSFSILPTYQSQIVGSRRGSLMKALQYTLTGKSSPLPKTVESSIKPDSESATVS
ncbi:UNVERIFIED_CONTAM: hypothetical protein HDU68_010838, partial [Siphonaria sp. JEL0065]